MLRQLLTNDITTIKRHIQSHAQGNGPMVVARITGMAGTLQVHEVREELYPVGPTRQQQERRLLQELPPLPLPQKRLEVKIDHSSRWYIAQVLYLRIDEGASETKEGEDHA